MKLSRFIFEGAKAASDFGELSMTYEAFLMGGMEKTQEYSAFLDKGFREANAFLQRVSQLGIVPLRIKSYEPEEVVVNGCLQQPSDCLKAVAVFQPKGRKGSLYLPYSDDSDIDPVLDAMQRGYDSIPFRKINSQVYMMVGKYDHYKAVFMQYKKRVPYFNQSDVKHIYQVNDSYVVDGDDDVYTDYSSAFTACENAQIDLEAEYGITDEVLSVGIDWIKGRSMEDVSRGHSIEMEAESRLLDFGSQDFVFLQTKTGGNL